MIRAEGGGLTLPRPVPRVLAGTFMTQWELGGATVRTNRTVASAFAAGTIYYWWFPNWQKVDIVTLGLAIRANAAASGSKKFALGIYTDASGLPGSLLGSTGGVTIAENTNIGDTGVHTAAAIALPPGQYWMAFVTDTARHATNWELDVCQEEMSSRPPLLARMARNTGSFNNGILSYPTFATEVRAWSDATPLPAAAAAARVYTIFTPPLSFMLGF